MVLNISFRTDIVACYPEWLIERLLHQQFIGTRNPEVPNVVNNFNTDSIEGIVFCSKDYSKILDYLGEINSKYKHNIYYYTITPYEEDIEPMTYDHEKALETLIKMCEIVGPSKIIWRYDPIFINEKYTEEYMIRKFEEYTKKIHGYIRFCTFNFLNNYKHVLKRMPNIDFTFDKVKFTEKMLHIALKYSMMLHSCSVARCDKVPGILDTGCITPELLGLNMRIDHSKMFPGCRCKAKTYGIGDYDTCYLNCLYCYANHKHVNKDNISNHLDSELMQGRVGIHDRVILRSSKIEKSPQTHFSYESFGIK